ncbi:MAG: hypothetical protein LBI28_11815 [Treponema sp.]|jgi:hypothetical protein|nr:hypothetical protein [Treponema sp.]
MKRNKFVPLIVFTLLVLPLFAHDADIEITGENRYKSLRLTVPVYNASHSRLIDLLIKDSSGEAVPYFINSSLQETNTSRETYPLILTDSYIKDDYFFFDYKLAEERNSDTIATSIEFTTRNNGFAKPVDVYGSHDGINWAFVQNDTLYSVEGKSKLAVNFYRSQKFTHYRFRLANNLERISFETVNLVYSVKLSEEIWFIENFIPAFTVETKDKTTKIIIEGLKNLRLCDLTIETDSMFIRNVSAPAGIRKELYYLTINDTVYNDTTLPLNRHISRDETFTVTIDDGDDRPVNIKAITVRYYADDLIFEGRTGETYTLEFGINSVKTAPVYDISRYKNEILKGTIDILSLGEIRYSEPEPERKTFPLKIIFNIVIIVVALLLGTLIVLRLKK